MTTEVVRLRVRSNQAVQSLVSARIPSERLGRGRSALAESDSGEALGVRSVATGIVSAAQYDVDAESLSFVLPGSSEAEKVREFDVVTGAVGSGEWPARMEVRLDGIDFYVGGQQFATYVVAGTRRPYIWPLVGPAGTSVVRGQGSGDHPHHTGLALNYGGHAEGGSVNLWSDWDEPPYGPGGRMLHRGFRRLTTGPVYGEAVQDLTYVDAYGRAFAMEVRTIRWWWASTNQRFLDVDCRVIEVTDRGTRPFIVMVRAPECFGIPGVGEVTNSVGAAAPDRVYTPESYYNASWVDASGPTGELPPNPPAGPPEELPDLREVSEAYRKTGSGPWSGIALFDHPSNDGYPNVVGKYATAQQLTQAHYPPEDAPYGPFAFKYRVFIHDGSAAVAMVDTYAAAYASAGRIEVR